MSENDPTPAGTPATEPKRDPNKCMLLDGKWPLPCATLWRHVRRTTVTNARTCGMWVLFGWIDGVPSGPPQLHGFALRAEPGKPAIMLNHCPFCGERIRPVVEPKPTEVAP